MTIRMESPRPEIGQPTGDNAAKFGDQELRLLAARASTLDERLADGYVPTTTAAGTHKIDTRYGAWVRSASGGDKAVFAQMCRHRGFDPDAILPLFGEVLFATGQATPAWADTFSELFTALHKEPTLEDTCRLVRRRLLPFEQLFYPAVDAVRRRRDDLADARQLALLSDRALADLDRALVETMAEISAGALTDCFYLTMHAAGRTLGSLGLTDRPLYPTNTNNRMAEFVSALREDGLKSFFADRPVLARLLSTVAEQWQSATLEFIGRLHRDLPREITTLNNGVTPGRVARIGTGLSDPHNGGRSVYKMTFENGLVVGYKPKDLRIDIAWSSLLDWLSDHGAPKSADCPRTEACDGYGWVEWVAPRDCSRKDEAREFFYRSGATMCLIRVLQGSDFHFENIIARGPAPVPVDLETIIGARPKAETDANGPVQALVAAGGQLDNSVLSTGYLPGWASLPGARSLLIGGLDHGTAPDTAHNRTPANRRGTNVPRLGGLPLQAIDYSAELMAGYQAMFTFLAERGGEIAARGGPLDRFEGLSFRTILRSTRVYGLLMQRALGRKSLDSGAGWSLHFDFLYRTSLTQQGPLPIASVCDYERASMAQADIPVFAGRTTSTDLVCGDGRIVCDFFRRPALDEVRDRLLSLETIQLDRDRLIIEQSLHTVAPESIDIPRQSGQAAKDVYPTGQQLIDLARRLSETIERSGIQSGGGISWLGLAPATADERTLQLRPMAPALYTGTVGVGLFQAALYRVTGDSRYRQSAMSCIAQALDAAGNPDQLSQANTVIPVGLGDGIGGLIYGFSALARLLDEPSIADAAMAYAGLLTDEKIMGCEDQGLYSGTAGAVIGLSALYHRIPDPFIADRLRTCADHLLTSRTRTIFGGRAWCNRAWAMPQAGLMHGASGIALAISRAGKTLNTTDFEEAIEQGLRYEHALARCCGGWPDLRDVDTTAAVANAPRRPDYSTGAAGIGIVGLELAECGYVSADRADVVDAALQEVTKAAGAGTDGLFSGNFGRIAFAMQVARERGDAGLIRQAETMIAPLLTKAEKQGQFQWGSGQDGDNPSLFDGASGVGLVLLWLARPDLVPNFSALEEG
ncbi:MAG: type 2 lanthipeptide synthetase LanM [Pseudomonadota bacterium]